MLEVYQQWEVGNIMLSNNGSQYVLHTPVNMNAGFRNGVSRQGSILLTIDEAKQLEHELKMQIAFYEQLEHLASARDIESMKDRGGNE